MAITLSLLDFSALVFFNLILTLKVIGDWRTKRRANKLWTGLASHLQYVRNQIHITYLMKIPVHERNRELAQNIRKVIELNTVTKDPLFNVFVAKELAYANRLERTLDDPYGPEKL